MSVYHSPMRRDLNYFCLRNPRAMGQRRLMCPDGRLKRLYLTEDREGFVAFIPGSHFALDGRLVAGMPPRSHEGN
jgi:hypothetical protein